MLFLGKQLLSASKQACRPLTCTILVQTFYFDLAQKHKEVKNRDVIDYIKREYYDFF